MILSTSEVILAIKGVLDPLLSPVKVLTILKPLDATRFVYLTELAENEINEKRAFLSEGFISIQIIEKLDSRGGDFGWVNDTAKTIVNAITPNRTETFGNVGNINIFTMQFDSAPTELQETETGRVAIKSLRLSYKSQNQ